MDPVTERTVSSIDLLIFSDISDSSLTLSNGGAHSHSPYTSNSHERKKKSYAGTRKVKRDYLLRLLLTPPRFTAILLFGSAPPVSPNRLLALPAV
jgi:hypothetical protein